MDQNSGRERRPIDVVVFVTLTLLGSFVWLVWRPYRPYTSEWPDLARIWLGWGAPLVGCLAALWFRRFLLSDRPTLLGTHPWTNSAMAAVPIVSLAPMGLNGIDGVAAPAAGLLVGVVVVGYAVLEEWGWRGYLAEALAIENRFWSALAVTCVWYPWHWWFLGDSSLLKQAILFGVLVGSSVGIGEIGRITRSVLACAGFHVIGNILFLFPAIARQLSMGQKGGILLFCVSSWVLLVRHVVRTPVTHTHRQVDDKGESG